MQKDEACGGRYVGMNSEVYFMRQFFRAEESH